MAGIVQQRQKFLQLSGLLAVSRGDEPADLVFRGGQLVNVISGEVYQADIAVTDGRIAGTCPGGPGGAGYEGRQDVDVTGKFLCPGMIDAHVHIESAMVPPAEFARAVLPRGVTAVVTDPHEIANVMGLQGVQFMLADAGRSPLQMYVNAPSCVPATHLETSGAELTAEALAPLLDEPDVLGLAEVMNYPGVVAGDAAMLDKIARFGGRPIDGHCPGLTGQALNTYAAAGIESDHECTTVDEAREKLRLGMTIFIREATVAHNLETLLPLVDPGNAHRICFCTDDRVPADLADEGSIDHMVRTAIARGLDAMTAIRMGTINVADHYRLRDRGAIAPGRVADVVVMTDLRELQAEQVYVAGRLVARGGQMLTDRQSVQSDLPKTVNIDWSSVDFAVPTPDGGTGTGGGHRICAIGIVPDQLVTETLTIEAATDNGHVVADASRDLAKLAVIERHRGTGNMAVGFVQGIGLRRGAIAGTVAHDHHNLVVAGVDDASMMTAARAVADTGGGLAAAEGDNVLALLALPIAGLMTDQPIEQVIDQMHSLIAAARQLGATLGDPFMALSFLALEVIPTLKLTDHGLVDVNRQQIVPLFV